MTKMRNFVNLNEVVMANDSSFLGKAWRYVYLHCWQYKRVGQWHARRIAMVEQRGKARVVLLAMSVPMWRYQHLWEALKDDPRFEVTIVISPSIDYDVEQQHLDAQGLRDYFEKRNMPYVDCNIEGEPYDIKGQLDPDVIFYPQPYEHLLVPEHDCMSFYDRLLCYYPYAYMTGNGKFSYDFHFHNLAWRLYYSNDEILHEAQRTATNKGSNVRIVGYPTSDDFMRPNFPDVWKHIGDGRERKRIIWAPHFSFTDKFGQIPRGNFLWVAHFMVDLAQRYKEHIQIAFKPHPRLLTELYAHPEWGKKRTDDFYQLWADMENTQLEMGNHVDLFMTSDAMIHDSGSFVIEYMYTHKPVMFISRDIDYFLTGQTDFSRQALAVHYIGKDEKEIRDFVDLQVLGGEDPMAEKRMEFYKRYLLPPNNKTVAQNTMDDLIESLHLK